MNRILNTIFKENILKKNQLFENFWLFSLFSIFYINTTIEKKWIKIVNNNFNYENKVHVAENKYKINQRKHTFFRILR